MRKYHIYAENLEKEVSPEELEDATKSSITIEKTLRELENEIPDEYKLENLFYNNLLPREQIQWISNKGRLNLTDFHKAIEFSNYLMGKKLD